MRIFFVPLAVTGGKTKTVSEKLNSAAIFCIWMGVNPVASVKTAKGLPPKMRSLKTSAV
jgi:hypothetical protein